ncbi:MAG: ribonuclease HII [Candidatus Pacearchaeota archaeon]
MVRVVGIDEAGRGPVIGPMIIAGVIIEEGKEAMLGEVKDSKLLFHNKRVKLNKHLRENFEYHFIKVDPKEIDDALNSEELNLNWLEAHKQAEIINKLKPHVAIIDAPSINTHKYTEYLQNLIKDKNIKLIVEHKADVNYPVCSAASIIAKVEREDEMKKIRDKYGDCGPGYPAHPKTQDFVKKHGKKYPEIMRTTWSTYKRYHADNNKSIMDY